MKTYKINDLYAHAWQSAIENVAAMLNVTMVTNFSPARDCDKIERLADRLGIDFTENGDIANWLLRG